MKEKRIPLRKCVGCGQMKPKSELIRVVRDSAGSVSLDPVGKKPGRGAYVCRQGHLSGAGAEGAAAGEGVFGADCARDIRRIGGFVIRTGDKGLGFIGLARKAGKLAVGADLTVEAVRAGRARLVLLAADAAENTRKRVCDKCAHYKAACVETAYTRETLGRAVGAGSLSCAAFLDAGFAEAYRQAAENDPKDPYTHRSSERKDW